MLNRRRAIRSWRDEPCAPCAQTGRVRVFGIPMMCLSCDGLGRVLGEWF